MSLAESRGWNCQVGADLWWPSFPLSPALFPFSLCCYCCCCRSLRLTLRRSPARLIAAAYYPRRAVTWRCGGCGPAPGGGAPSAGPGSPPLRAGQSGARSALFLRKAARATASERGNPPPVSALAKNYHLLVCVSFQFDKIPDFFFFLLTCISTCPDPSMIADAVWHCLSLVWSLCGPLSHFLLSFLD